MKKLLFLLIIPFLSFGQCIDGDFDNDGICDEFDNCVGTWIPEIVTGNCSQFTSQGADACNSYSGCEWIYSWGGWVTGGSSDCVGSYEMDNGYCDELVPGCTDENACNYNSEATYQNIYSCNYCSCSDTTCTEIVGLNLSECSAFIIKDQNNEIGVDFSLDTYMGWCGADPWTNILSLNYCFSPGCYTLEIVDYCSSCPMWWDPSTFGSTLPGDPTIQIGQQEFFYQDDSFCEPMQFSFDGFNINEGCNLIYLTDTVYITDTVIQTEYITDTIVETEYVEVIMTEFIDCDTGLPCTSGMAEIIEKSKTNGKIYNLLGQEIIRREGIYIEAGEITYRF